MIKRTSPLSILADRSARFGVISGRNERSNDDVAKPVAEAPRQPEPAVFEPKAGADEMDLTRMPDTFADPEPTPTVEEKVAEKPKEPALVLENPKFSETAETAKPVEPAAPAPSRVRKTSRVKTTLLGFDRSDGRSEDLFKEDAPQEKKREESSKFPTGWLVIVDGPGRGTSIALGTGVSQIGRGDDQGVQLDYGDMGISRSNHAAIAYDAETRAFYLGHGGKANIVRLNGKPVLSTETLGDGDLIRIGETTLSFVAFCNEEFCWTDSQ